MDFYIEHFGSERLRKKVRASHIRILEELKGKKAENLRNLQSGDYFTFMFVRHPFDRLLSAYRDRILDNFYSYQANKFIPEMLREAGIENRLTKHSKKGQKLDSLKDEIKESELPTFEMFLKYIIKHGVGSDTHWNSYVDTCQPCAANYTVIGHLETSEKDEEYILRHSRLGRYSDNKGVTWKHVTKNGNSEMWRQKYFSQIPCDILRKLAEMYKYDFEFFGYKPEIYFEMCRKI